MISKKIRPTSVIIEIDPADISPPDNVLIGQIEDFKFNKYGGRCLIVSLKKTFSVTGFIKNVKKILICGYGIDVVEELYSKTPKLHDFPIVINIYAIMKEFNTRQLNSWNGLVFLGRGEVKQR